MNDKKKILLIDDEDDFCFFVKGNLERTGEFEVRYATCGSDGIGMARRERPDLILLDIVMPGMTGQEVAEVLLTTPETKDVPIIFLTAIVTKDEAGPGVLKRIGGRYFIAKPVSTGDLAVAIRKIA